MKTPIALALGVVALLAATAVTGYAAINHWTLPFLGGGERGLGTLDVYIRDTPATWAHVNVTFSELQAHAADQGDESGWHNVTFATRTIDLAKLTSIAQLLGTGNLPEGKYTQLRIVVVSADGVMSDGTPVTFTIPSGELRTVNPFNITTGQTTSLTVDIDLSRSIVQTAVSWILSPVIGSVEVH